MLISTKRTCLPTLGRNFGILQHSAAAAKFDSETMERPLAERKILGDATDQATLRFAETLRPVHPLSNSWKQAIEIPFNSKNKVLPGVTN